MTAASKDWKRVDAELRRLAGSRAAMDYEEGRWLLAARRTAAHEHLGFASIAQYIESVLGHNPHATGERLRVAEALEGLPRMAEALHEGRMCWSVVRELTRVAVPETEGEWIEDAAGKTARDVEKRVAGYGRGDRPTDRPNPNLRPRVLRFKVRPEVFALFREAVGKLRKEIDPTLGDEDALAEMARRVLGDPKDEGRSPYQVVLSHCEECSRTWQRGRGEQVEVGPEVAEQAACDAQKVGSQVGEGRIRKAVQSMAPAIRRLVVHRHHGRCSVPGCRNTQNLEVHHTHLRSEGGDHDPEKLVLLCGRHHHLAHMGLLIIEGTFSDGFVFRHADGTRYGDPPSPASVEAFADAFAALRALGLKEGEARDLLAASRSHVGPSPTREELVTAALRQRGSSARTYVMHAREEWTTYGQADGAGPPAPTWEWLPGGTPAEYQVPVA